jgi:hypothetical protein
MNRKEPGFFLGSLRFQYIYGIIEEEKYEADCYQLKQRVVH